MYRLLMHPVNGARVTTNLTYTWQQVNGLAVRFDRAGKYNEICGQYAELKDCILQWDMKKETLSDYLNPEPGTMFTFTLYTPIFCYPCVGMGIDNLKDAWKNAYRNYRLISRTEPI